ncbi:uncharacterized protein LOC18437594 [Amborella trichopoda]|uniref:J domain-containing protein n=1 Tax=Amborella trichopoda TaxID=13333 RepID=W1PNY6_AMBTC|nr:uncharacterized protein LOC18437594 [Amborella trichopoda]ERN09441.1 hypothetical protein AMTR_s00029p00078660 [Amborella trichopoda]|eukprot:XP_006847860.1 uncharacterized protein LOC18437594 [Amborella trichopoda]
MAPCSGLLINGPYHPAIKPSKTRNFNPRKSQRNALRSMSCNLSQELDCDLYELLGIDSTSDQSQIKNAYRSLQKRCHPDIAGPAGHDMAIILNQAYSVLSDPCSRLAYDKEQGKMAEVKGYTGKPIYSTWFGSANEQRAVFVDEVKCVGCLKCALAARNTFAIEAVYGRARVVSQWADPEDTIEAAIQACPVDCISVVERSKLAALEFLMSKQPRGNVRMNNDNTVGARVANVFVDAERLQKKFNEKMQKSTEKSHHAGPEESDLQRAATRSAMQTIRSISQWWTKQSPTPTKSDTKNPEKISVAKRIRHPQTKKLEEAAKRRLQNPLPPRQIPANSSQSEYWVPKPALTPTTKNKEEIKTSWNQTNQSKGSSKEKLPTNVYKDRRISVPLEIPVTLGLVAAMTVGLRDEGSHGGLDEHIAGSAALHIVNSYWLRVILAGFTWYFLGLAVIMTTILLIGSWNDHLTGGKE